MPVMVRDVTRVTNSILYIPNEMLLDFNDISVYSYITY